MIFQPTNVIPSATGSLGDGTVDVTAGLNVSWMVNGNSPMTAFEITIFQNNADSTKLFSTGTLADNCPFYGVNYNGEQQYFTYHIPASSLISAGIVNGSEYKLVITQFWGNNEEDSVVQTSASAFITRSFPRIAISPITSPMASKSYTFYGIYTQDQGDNLNWVRWQIAYADDTENPFYDSGNIYGTAELKMTYDGFFSGSNYAVRLLIQTENGVIADTGFETFEVRYATSEAVGVITATCAGKGHSAVKVSWPLLSYLPGKASGNYSIKGNNRLVLDFGANITWNEQNGKQLLFKAPYSVIFKFKVRDVTAEIFALNTTAGRITLYYDSANYKLYLMQDAKELFYAEAVFIGSEITAIITPQAAFFRFFAALGGRFPSDTLYPRNNLYPAGYSSFINAQPGKDISYTQGDITSVNISSGIIVDYLQILNTEVSQEVIDGIIKNNFYEPSFDGHTYFLADFTDGLNAGNIKGVGGNLTGLALYRQSETDRNLEKIGSFSPGVSEVYDYTAKSQQGPYTYYIFPESNSSYISAPLVSNKISPCFWNWSVISCSERNDGTFEVEAEYLFGKNLSSGSIGNNNSPTILNNFTRFPTVQPAAQNYQSGTLVSLIGYVDKNARYSDSVKLRDAIWGLSVTKNILFLKNRKGDFFQIKTAGPINMETMDNTKEQAQTVNLPWVQISDGEKEKVFSLPTDEFFGEI